MSWQGKPAVRRRLPSLPPFVAFTISFAGNRRVQRTVGAAYASAATLPRETSAIPPTEALAKLKGVSLAAEELKGK